MLVSFSKITDFFILSAVNVQFRKIPVSDLIWSSRTEDDNVVIIIRVRLLLLEILLSFFWVNIKSEFMVVIISDPCLGFDLSLYFFNKLLCFFESDVWFFIIWKGFLLSDLLFSQSFCLLWAWMLIIKSGLSISVFLL